MAGPGRSRRGEPWVSPGDGTDHITALPLELRAGISASLAFRQVTQLATLSRPWRHIHRHAPVDDLDLDDFVFLTDEMLDEEDFAAVNDDALARLEIALARRGQDRSASKVDTLKIAYSLNDPRVTRHAGLMIALANAREIHLTMPRDDDEPPQGASTVDLSPSARDLEVVAFRRLVPIVAGPGAAALQTLCLRTVVLREWPRLPSLRSLTLDDVFVEASYFQPGAYCPRLESMCIFNSEIVPARVDIRLPHLKILEMDRVYVIPGGDITVDAPELEELNVDGLPGCAPYYETFTLRAPRLRCLTWSEVFPDRVGIHVGRPGSVTSGRIRFTWNREFEEGREMEHFRAQMMQMLEGLLPELPPECVVDAARPYISLDKYTADDPGISEPIPEEKLTCDLSGLMSSLKA